MSFLSELKRRNVVRVAVVYGAVGWILVEISSVVLPTFGAPEWIMKVLVFMVMIGFPVALIFAWAFELTPDGLKWDKDVERPRDDARRVDRTGNFTIIGVLAITIAVVVLYRFEWLADDAPTPVASAIDIRSIAILPFTNISGDEANEPFTIGIHDDLLTHLSKISSIKTISRTSVKKYRNTYKTIPQIAKELGVATVLEGGVQRAGNRVRINAQLIDARTDVHLWAETYDRQLTVANIFAIQSQIAVAIATALQATLAPKEQQRIAAVPTRDFAAYEAYLLGKQRMAKRTSAALAEAVDYFRKAIELDPKFALAYVGLADSYNLQVTYSGMSKSPMEAKAKIAIGRALELDDQLGEAYASAAVIKQTTGGNLRDTEADFLKAIKLAPNYATAHHWYANFLAESGRFEEGLVQLNHALELDPLSAIVNDNIAGVLFALGRFDDALAQYEKTIEIEPDLPNPYRGIAKIYQHAIGWQDEAVAWYRKSLTLDQGNPIIQIDLGVIYLDLGDDTRAERYIEQAITLAPESPHANAAMAVLHLYRKEFDQALVYAQKVAEQSSHRDGLIFLRDVDMQAGRHDQARGRYQAAHPALFVKDAPVINRMNFESAVDLALLLAAMGEQERADLLLDKTLSFIKTLPRLGIGYGIADVQIYALQGKTQQALTAFRHAVDKGWRSYWWYFTRFDLALEPLRNEPEFQAIVSGIKTDMAIQLKHLREMEKKET